MKYKLLRYYMSPEFIQDNIQDKRIHSGSHIVSIRVEMYGQIFTSPTEIINPNMLKSIVKMLINVTERAIERYKIKNG